MEVYDYGQFVSYEIEVAGEKRKGIINHDFDPFSEEEIKELKTAIQVLTCGDIDKVAIYIGEDYQKAYGGGVVYDSQSIQVLDWTDGDNMQECEQDIDIAIASAMASYGAIDIVKREYHREWDD